MLLVRNAMRVDSLHISPQATLRESAEKMVQYGVEALPVVENDKLVGVIRLADLLTAPLSAQHEPHVPENRDEAQLLETWEHLPVRNIMTEQILSVTEDTPLAKTAALMINNRRQRLPVLRGNRVVGMVSRADIVRALLIVRKV